jgi:protocatechuate 3,4-dioxygenase beta subunit
MKKRNLLIITLSIILYSCQGQKSSKTIIGGGCDGCELMYVNIPRQINDSDTSMAWNEKGQKLLITGNVFQGDGRTPAENVIIYYWQTDQNGLYSSSEKTSKGARRHGRLRGWVKSNSEGKYAIYTTRPAPYPNQKIPAHIHLSIKEPNLPNEYYVDELVFDDDVLLTRQKRNALENRGGSGVLRVLIDKEVQVAEHNIILGLHIPNYPKVRTETVMSGLEIGEDQPSFTPFHAFGPDKGTRTCPVCKYGRYHGVVIYVGNRPNWVNIEKWLKFLDDQSIYREQYLKAYFVYGNEINYDFSGRKIELEKLGSKLNLQKTALTFVPSFRDMESEVNLNRINPEVENTIIIYKNRNIREKFVNLDPTPQNMFVLKNLFDKTEGDFFFLEEPSQH